MTTLNLYATRGPGASTLRRPICGLVCAMFIFSVSGCGTEPADADASALTDGSGPDGSGSDSAGQDPAGQDTAGQDAAGQRTGDPVVIGPPRSLALCDGSTHQRYAPLANTSLDVLPDDFWTTPDAATATGIRLAVDDTTPWIGSVQGFDAVVRDLSRLDGWGTTAALFLRFDADVGTVPSGEVASLTNTGVQLWQLEPTPVRLPFEATTIDDGTTMILAPMLPLRPKTRHALVVTRAHKASGGSCIAPSKTTAALLERTVTAPTLIARVPSLEAALSATMIAPADVSAISVFTTQSIVEESLAVAKDIRARTFKWSQPVTCSKPANKPYQLCEGRFVGQDYRKGREVLPTPQAPLEHIVRVWLPKTGSGPWPVIVFGHGLTGAKDQGEPVAVLAAPMNAAVVAIDAVAHGKHPAGGATGLAAVLKFFGIDAATLSFDFLALRDNWRQSTYDKLQLLRLLAQQPDVDGDGTADLDPTKMAYVGVSLGGIMGPELLALTDAIGVAVLSVPGGKVSSIIESSTEFSPLIMAFKPDTATDGDIARFFPIVQTLIERGDAANWGPHVLTARLPGVDGGRPSVLMQMAIDDEIVPNVATRALVRGMGVPQVGPELQSVGIVPNKQPLPLSGNLNGGETTAGLFQFDQISKSPGKPMQKAGHGSVPASQEALAQDKVFLQSWLAGKVPEIVNPYVL